MRNRDGDDYGHGADHDVRRHHGKITVNVAVVHLPRGLTTAISQLGAEFRRPVPGWEVVMDSEKFARVLRCCPTHGKVADIVGEPLHEHRLVAAGAGTSRRAVAQLAGSATS